MPNVYETRFGEHPVHSTLSRCAQEVGRLRTEPWGSPEGDALEHVAAAEAAVEHVVAVLAVQDPRLVTMTALNVLDQQAVVMASHLEAFNAARSLTSAETVAAAIEPLLFVVAQHFTVQLNGDATRVLGQAEQLLRDRTRDALLGAAQAAKRRLREVADTAALATTELQTAVTAATADVAAAGAEAASVATTATAQAAAAQDSLKQELERFTTTTTQLEALRTAAVDQIQAALAGMETRFAGTLGTQETAASASLRKYEQEHETLLGKVRTTSASAENVLALAGGAALSGRWIRQADRQFLERLGWYAAIVLLLAGSIWVGYSELDELTVPLTYSRSQSIMFYVPRLPFAVVTITVLGFAIQQAGRRAQWEARDRRVANELTAFPAFLERVSDTDRSALAKSVADRYFPGPQLAHDQPPPDPAPTELPALPAKLIASVAGGLALIVAVALAASRLAQP